ncbi:MFS transporter [Nereida sp. MMG025]|uniref:MFS transporter n=1 Tax=Nereida sp. MMG025 TaxID=2909981 RepID=UPI001EFFD10B|nr:MFS transporter [Nereida sp. MMG025]MCF6443637.1 MFS transporter [Nereida sp. MMG025]
MERTQTDWLLVGLIFILGLFAAAQFGKVSLLLPDLAAHYDTGMASVAPLVSMVGLIGIAFGVIAGAVAAKYGLKTVLLVAIWLGAALSLAQSLLPDLPVLFVLRLFEGVSHLAIVVAAPPIMAAAANDAHRAIAMSIWAMFFGVSFAILAAILPALIAMIGVSGVFLSHGVGLAIMALVLMWRIPSIEREPAVIEPIQAHKRAYSSARIAAPAMAFVFYTLIYIALLTFLPIELGKPSLGTWLPLFSLIGTFGAGWLARWIHPYILAGLGFVLTIVCVLIAMWGGLWVLAPLFALMGLIPGACFAAIPHLNASTKDRARASGVLAQMGNIGTSSGTPIFALALSAGGLSGLWSVTLLACLIGLGLVCVMWWALSRQQ